MPLYELRNIEHTYDVHPVLTIDHWQVPADMVTGVVGPNGSGKSTLLSLLGFITTPTEGTIQFNGQPADPFSERVRGKVAILPQDAFLLKRSVYGNVAYGLKLSKSGCNVRKRVHEAMEMVGLDVDSFIHRPWFALSGGEVRRVALAARLALQPKVLLMDEPTTSVDAASTQLIKEAALHARQQWGATLVVTSHDTQWLADMCDRTVHLFRGRIMGSGQHTLVFGPWKPAGRGRVARVLNADQSFEVAQAPHHPDSAVAALPAEKAYLFLEPSQIPDTYHQLTGRLLRMNFEKTSQRVNASVAVGNTVITAYLPEDEVAACRYNPGQGVWVAYNPGDIEWF